MSHAFEARFSPTELALPEILQRLERCLDESQIDYAGEVAQLHSRGGQPTVLSLATHPAPTLAGVATLAKSWWGVSLFALSRPLAASLGKSDSIEVYLRVFKVPAAGRMLVYNENAGAFRARADSDELTRDLVALLVRTADALDAAVAIYAEEGEETAAPTVAEVEERLSEQARSGRGLAWLAAVKTEALDLGRARHLAGRWAERLKLSTTQYVVLPFLAGGLDE